MKPPPLANSGLAIMYLLWLLVLVKLLTLPLGLTYAQDLVDLPVLNVDLESRIAVHASHNETASQKCREDSGKRLGKNEILLAYSIDGYLEALAVFDGKDYIPADGREFKHINEMYNMYDNKWYPVTFDAYLTPLGPDRCIWCAKLKGSEFKAVSIFATRPVKIDMSFDRKNQDLFYSIRSECVNQGDPTPEMRRPCTKPQLVATSDLNSNGRLEFWFTYPLTWDTGFAINELSESGTGLLDISVKCFDCD